MHLILDNVFETQAIKHSDFLGFNSRVPEFFGKFNQRGQGFHQIFTDKNFLAEVQEIKKFAKIFRGKYDKFVLLGIGGSALGARVLRDSLADLKSRENFYILDNIDSAEISEVADNLDFSRTLFLVISKSGETIETRTQYEFFRGILTAKNLTLAEHFVFITGKSGFLREEADKKAIKTFSVPQNVGGRFSVLTAVGLLPAAILGIKIDELLAGAENSAKKFQNPDFGENKSFQLAVSQFLAKKNINVLMPYSSKMKSFSAWWAQLLAESTGKDGKGITPIPAVGVTDQHSQLQLFLDGPQDKLVIFIDEENSRLDFMQKNNSFKPGLRIFQKLMQAEKQGTEKSMTEKNVPNLTIKIPEISAKFLGELFMLFMGATAFLGEFMEINAFDQPGVERGKELARKLIIKS